jgi:Ca2+-binding EF-hand superfamily protein
LTSFFLFSICLRFIDFSELSALESGMAVDWNVEKFLYMLDEDRSGNISFEEFQQWYIRSERRIEDEMKKVFDKFDTDGDGKAFF